MANCISEGINALWALNSVLAGPNGASVGTTMAARDINEALGAMEQALSALSGSETVTASFRPSDEDCHRLRRLRPLVTVWLDTGVVSMDLPLLAEEALARALSWR